MTVRELNGWAPASVTYGPDGEVLWTTVMEPRFTRDEVEVLLESRRVERDRGPHGVPLSEATDPANRGRFTVPPPTLDFAEEALSKAQEAYRKLEDRPPMEALLWRVEKAD